MVTACFIGLWVNELNFNTMNKYDIIKTKANNNLIRIHIIIIATNTNLFFELL